MDSPHLARAALPAASVVPSPRFRPLRRGLAGAVLDRLLGRGRVAAPRTAEAAAAVRLPEALQQEAAAASARRAGVDGAMPSGCAALDAALSAGGWPCRTLTELQLAARDDGSGALRLLAPALAATLRSGRLVMLFDPPPSLSVDKLAQWGLDARQLLVVDGRSPLSPQAGSLWALGQSLASGNVGAVVAWLPPSTPAGRIEALREAARRHDGPAFLLREPGVADGRPAGTSCWPRIALRQAGADRLVLRLHEPAGSGDPAGRMLQVDLPPTVAAARRPPPLSADGRPERCAVAGGGWLPAPVDGIVVRPEGLALQPDQASPRPASSAGAGAFVDATRHRPLRAAVFVDFGG